MLPEGQHLLESWQAGGPSEASCTAPGTEKKDGEAPKKTPGDL